MNPYPEIQLICDCAEQAHRLIHELYERDPHNETFEQVGFLDGKETVLDYISHGESGVALMHLLYMIHESDIRFDPQQVVKLHALAKYYEIDNYYTAESHRLSGGKAYNIPLS